MKVMLADIEAVRCRTPSQACRSSRRICAAPSAMSPIPESVERAAQGLVRRLRQVHVVCNNAGVAAGGGIDHISLDNWRWVIDVNVMGVLHGVRASCRISARTAKAVISSTPHRWRAMQTGLGFSPYGASKFAVVSMSEGLAVSSAPHGIGVSVLCPYFVRTGIGESGRNRPERYGQAAAARPGEPGGCHGGRNRKGNRGRARSRPRRRARARSHPRQRTLYFHPSRHAGRGGGAFRRHFGRDGPGSTPNPLTKTFTVLFLPAKRR